MKSRLFAIFRDPWALALLALALGVRLLHLPARTLWSDEAYSVSVANHSWADIWNLAAVDVHPPLYYLLLHGTVQVFGDSLWAIRGLSVAAGTLAVLLAGCWVRLFATRRALYWVLLLLALQPIAVRYSQEARMYALLSCWLMAASLVLALGLRRPRHKGYPLVYALLAAAALYTHYFALFGLASHGCFVWLTAPGRRLLRHCRWWLANLAILGLFAPWLPHLYRQLHATGGLLWIPPLDSHSVPTLLWTFFWIDRHPLLNIPALGVLVPLLWVWALWQNRWEGHFLDRTALALLALLPIVGACLVSLCMPLFIARYLTFTALPLLMLVGLAIERLHRRHAVAAWVMLGLVVAVQGVGLFNSATVGEQLNGPAGPNTRRGSVYEFTQTITQQWAPGDEAVIEWNFYMVTLYYLRKQPLPWLRLDGAAPSFSGAEGPLLLLPRAPWLWHYAQLPSATCGVWLLSELPGVIHAPPAATWVAQGRWTGVDSQLGYYRRRACDATASPALTDAPGPG